MTSIIFAHPWHVSFNKSILDAVIKNLKDGDTVYIKEVNPERIDEEILEDDYANEEFPQDSDMMDESIEKALK